MRIGLLESGFGGLLPLIQSEIIESGLRDVVGQSRGLNKFAKLYKARGTHLEALAADKDQLFAEAVHLFKAGASYAQEASWREDNRRVSNGDQVHMVSGLAMKPDQGYHR